MSKVPRNHHYLPVFFLAGFTRRSDREGQLVVVDGKDGRTWRGKPENVACEKDFYSLEAGDDGPVSPNAVEDAYGAWETRAAPMLAELLRTHRLPRDAAGMLFLLHLVATNLARGIGSRALLRRHMNEIAKRHMRDRVSSKEKYEALLAEMKAAGIDVSGHSYEDAKAISDQDAMFYEVDRSWMIGQQILSLDNLLPILGGRTWSLAVSDVSGAEFICSDKPVHARPAEPGLPGNLRLDDPRASVVMPLSRRVALVGKSGGKRGAKRADRRFVADVNFGSAAFAYRYVYLPDEDMTWTQPNGSPGGIEELKKFMVAREGAAVQHPRR